MSPSRTRPRVVWGAESESIRSRWRSDEHRLSLERAVRLARHRHRLGLPQHRRRWSSPSSTARARRPSAGCATCSTSPACSTGPSPSRGRAATEEELQRVHTAEYVERVKRESDEGGGDGGELAPFGPGGYEIALLSAGGAIATIEAVWSGELDNAYALEPPARPPRRARRRPRLLRLRQHRDRGRARARGARRRAGRDRRLGRPPRQRHRARLLRRPRGADRSPSTRTASTRPNRAWSSTPARAPARASRSTCRCRRARATAPTWRRSSGWWCRRSRHFEPEIIVIASGLDASMMDPLAMMMRDQRGLPPR